MCVSVCTRSSLLRSNLRFHRASFFPFSFSVLGIRSCISEITRRFCSFGSNVSFPPSPSVSHLCGFPNIAKGWKNEALASESRDFREAMADWCLDELRHKATLVPDGSGSALPLIVYNGDVVKSDNIVPVEFKKLLQDAVKIFQDKIPETLKDWHPGSDEKVWDLVHPSLFPMVYCACF